MTQNVLNISDQSIQISSDAMFSIDLIQSLLAEHANWHDGNKVVAAVMNMQFKENIWKFVEDMPAVGIYKAKTLRMFSCEQFEHELIAVITYRNSNDEVYEYVEYTTQSSIDRKKAFKTALDEALKEPISEVK